MIAVIAVLLRILCFLYAFTVILPRAWKFATMKRDHGKNIAYGLFGFVLYFNINILLQIWFQLGRANPNFGHLSLDFITVANLIMQVITVVVFTIMYL